MGAAWYWARGHMRRRWRASMGLALLVAVAVAVPLATATGARRTGSVAERAAEALAAADASVSVNHLGVPLEGQPDPVLAEDLVAQRLAAMPEVDVIGRPVTVMAQPRGMDHGFFEVYGQAHALASGRDIDRVRLERGRLPDPAATDEILVSPEVASALDVEIGDPLVLETIRPETLLDVFASGADAIRDGPALTATVVGVGRPTAQVYGEAGLAKGTFVLSEAFWRQYRDEVGMFSAFFTVRLAPGVSYEAFSEAASSNLEEFPVAIANEQDRAAHYTDGLRLHESALWAFTVVAALVALVAVGQGVARHVRALNADHDALVALGGSTRQLRVGSVLAALPSLGVGVVWGSLAAVAASGLFPIGIGRTLEPSPGLQPDFIAVAPGAAAVLVFGVAIAVIVAAAARRTSRRTVRHSRIPLRAGALGAPPAVVLGLGFAYHPGPERSVPVRQALFAATAGVVGVAAALTFAAAFERFLDDPAYWGSPWDLEVPAAALLESEPDVDGTRALAADLADDDGVVGAALVTSASGRVGGRTLTFYALEQLKGDVSMTLVEGRAPRGEDEIALGLRTLRGLGRAVGDRVVFSGGDGEHRELEVVGAVVLPTINDTTPTEGAAMSAQGLRSLGVEINPFNMVVLDVAPGQSPQVLVDHAAGGAPTIPAIVGNLHAVDSVPWAIAIFVGLLGVLAAAHAQIAAVRHRRVELATVRSLGLTPVEAGVVVVVQAFAFALTGLALGVVLGIATGRTVWSAFAHSLGFGAGPVTPWLALAGLVVVTLVGAALVAVLPARQAVRLRPGQILRAE